ncbi:lysophospholipid acyltransferase family protein [Synechocystis sp. LKSZ1]|uniref:lysophospholipid acyltransferase family protein n=1 Tax=Synechocystis sp. LKSZ1 TaxID=3144951 RepID=UPI00336C0020
MLPSTLALHPELQRYRVSPWLMGLIYPLGARILIPFYFGKIIIHGQEHIPRSGPVIVAPTHRSRWDALLISLAVGRRASGRDLRFMVTATEVQGLQGWFIRRLGGFPIDLKRLESSSLRYSVALLKAGEMLVIFPEGGIFHDDHIHPLKRGVGRIALEVEHQLPGSQVSILPVSLRYSRPYPTWGTKVEIHIGEPLRVDTYDLKTMKASSEKLTQDLQARLQALQPVPVTEMVQIGQ